MSCIHQFDHVYRVKQLPEITLAVTCAKFWIMVHHLFVKLGVDVIFYGLCYT